MKVSKNVSLSKMTTFRLGGKAAQLWRPESVDDLSVLPRVSSSVYRVLSAGSNLLINDAHVYSDVVCMDEFDRSIESIGGGFYRVGASVRIQKLIRRIHMDGCGGIEELISIPAMLGGLICMNASVPSAGVCISDHLISVEVFDGERVVTIPKDECGFGHRRSRFQDGRSIILSATFRFPEQDLAVSAERIRARRELVKETQDHSHPNFGSVFRKCDPRIMSVVRKVGLRKGGASFSRKASNWLLNDGATFADALGCIERVERLHRLLRRPCEREVVVWE